MTNAAIIAVHGVADQRSGETARSVASLLQTYAIENSRSLSQRIREGGMPEDEIARVTRESQELLELFGEGFTEQAISLPVQRMAIEQRPETTSDANGGSKWTFDNFDERSQYLRQVHKVLNEKANPASLRESILRDASIEFTCDQVRNYDPQNPDYPDRENSVYNTLRLKNQSRECEASSASAKRNIDIYEMYWADLSRLGTGWTAIFWSFYQLLFHLCSLGRDAIDFTKQEFEDGELKGWWIARTTHSIVNFALTLVVPMLNLCLLLTFSIIIPANVKSSYGFFAVVGVAIAIGLGGTCFGLAVKGASRAFSATPRLIVLGSLLTSVALILVASKVHQPLQIKILVFEWLIIATVVMCYLIQKYSVLKPQVAVVGGVLWLSTLLNLLAMLYRFENSRDGMASLAIHTGVLVFALLMFTWMVIGVSLGLYYICYFLFQVTWRIKQGKLETGPDSQKARALWTGFLSLILPITLFGLITITLYTPLLYLASGQDTSSGESKQISSESKVASSDSTLPGIKSVGQDSSISIKSWFHLPNDEVMLCGLESILFWGEKERPKVSGIPDWMFHKSVTPLLPFALSLWAIAGGVAFYSFYLSVLVESSRPLPKKNLEVDHSRFVGERLTAGFRRLTIVILLLFVVFPMLFCAGAFIHNEELRGRGLVMSIGAALFGLIITGKLGEVVSKFWPPLDLVLDVDNYLRLRPTAQNPKSRIMTRYVALLRHLAERGYDRVIIVSHSQGTVISADLLRFLRNYHDPSLVALGFGKAYQDDEEHSFPNLFLLTMGCPLRQLYGWRFPHLYGWARHDHVIEDEDERVNQAISTECKPSPKQLGLSKWINAYCSGDYVGRHLWRSESIYDPKHNSETLFTPWDGTEKTESRDGADGNYSRRELCFGVGAHTHYFTDNRSDVAKLIHDLLSS